jgi:putative copper resistance protein D
VLRRRLHRLVWASLALGILSGIAWLGLEARSMSGRPFADALSPEVIGTVLARTRFGHDWELRGLLVIPLVICLTLSTRRRSVLAWAAFWLALLLGAAELAMLAGAGHAAAGVGWPGQAQKIGDAAHLLAAGAWVGGLLPLALLFSAARAENGLSSTAAYAATRRFSVVGVLAVGTLVATGGLNALFLVGSFPALLGTDYGHLLLLKLALFIVMVVFAAINRQWLTPQLGDPTDDARRKALRRLRRNALIEATLAATLLVVLGALGTTPPALHGQPQWPLPFRLSLDAIAASPALQLESALAGAAAVAGLWLFVYGLARPRRRMAQLLVGLFVVLATGWWPLQFMVVTAYPSSFYRSTVPLTVGSVARGAEMYAENCAACHGDAGRGNGPLAKSTPVAPADLTAEHFFEHSEGDLFWWVSAGIPTGGMPGFGGPIDERGRWDIINFIRARAAAAHPGALLPEVTANPAPLAPDFSFEQGGRQETLRRAAAHEAILLVFYRLPGSLPRLKQLADDESRLTAAGLRLLALPLAREDEQPPPGDFAAAPATETAAAYALFAGAAAEPCEFLIDRAGFLRARWIASSGFPDAPTLAAQLDRLAALPLHPLEEHGHAH